MPCVTAGHLNIESGSRQTESLGFRIQANDVELREEENTERTEITATDENFPKDVFRLLRLFPFVPYSLVPLSQFIRLVAICGINELGKNSRGLHRPPE